MTKPFASSADLTEKTATLEELADGVYAYTAQGDPNVGAVVGADAVLCVEARATPYMAQKWMDELRTRTDVPIRDLVLTHYHAVRTLGAAAFGAQRIISSQTTLELIHERGQQDWESEAGRMPRLFAGAETIPGLTIPTETFTDRTSVDLGGRVVELLHLGRGHTEGDIVVWLPEERICFAGDLVEGEAALYTGDAIHLDWMSSTLDGVAALGAQTMVGGRGRVMRGSDEVRAGIDQTRGFLQTMRAQVEPVLTGGGTLKEAFDAAHAALEPAYGTWPIFEHCMPFNVSRLWDELSGIARPRIWTAERDREVWAQLQS
ncbi:MAG: MBL fold metallo-hydrolase [Geodermatophilaceae bacterium]|nr:MBL fold metallo-hydrolase [Geodermatophilaceae bacterium]MDQ3465361.1 MBL fold metallo-hydrolase [Actinomycetota bacterium]